MQAFISHKGKLVATRKPLPRLAPGWARVGVRLAGICNTDLEILRGYHNFTGTPGHEFVGEVEAVEPPRGPRRMQQSVAKRWLGRRVVGEINIACTGLDRSAPCDFCRRRIPTHCRVRRVLGIVAHDGAFAESLALPLVNLRAVPPGVPDECAVFTEPLAAACQILEQVPLDGLRDAAVVGDGKLAQLIARVLAASRLRVIMFGKHASKLALAHRAGVSTVLAAGKSRGGRRAGEKFRLVVEATGSPTGLGRALELTEPRGTLVLKSTFHGTTEMETWPVVVHEVTLVGSRCGPFPRALDLLRTRRVDPRPLISRVFPLAQAPDAIAEAARRGVMKVLLSGVKA